MATPNNKVQEFQDAGAAIGGFGAAKLAHAEPEERLQNVFSIAHDAGTHRKQTDLVQQLRAGSLDVSQLSIRVGGADAIRLNNEIQKTKQKQTNDLRALLALLDDIERVADAIDAANERIREGLDDLKDTYGDDYVQVVAGSVLTDEEIAGCATEDELLILMAEKAFDEDGNLRPGFEHLDPRMIEVLSEVHEREKLKLEGAALVEEYQANGGEMTPQLEAQAQKIGVQTSIFGADAMNEELGQNEITETIEEAALDTFGNTISGGF